MVLVSRGCLLFLTGGLVHAVRQRRKVAETNNGKTYHIRVEQSVSGCEILADDWGQVHRLAVDEVVQTEPQWMWKEDEEEAGMDSPHSSDRFIDFYGPSRREVMTKVMEECGSVRQQVQVAEALPQNTEMRCVVCSGESENRIDVVFMGDGYTIGERERFFDDMARLTKDMFEDETFRSYLPVFNIWAIHVPSVESGIGYYGRSKNTPFQLYKNGVQHRGVLPTGAGQRKARETCKLAPGCDYPSIIANDEFYGGLGGEFVIGTRSKTTGTIVLRHEMGHNFVSVGEEYDNGGVYRGYNSDKPTFFGRPANNIKWKHWLTEQGKSAVEQKQKQALAKYPWKDLAKGQETFTFKADGKYSKWAMTFTVSGFPEMGSLKVTLDGKELNWEPNRPFGAERPDGTTVDRQFYHFNDTVGFSSGTHTLRFESAFPPPAGAPIRQLCSLGIYEYGNSREFNSDPNYIGAYPVWSQFGSKNYRPTNEMCLMRNMESTLFCPVCREGMWLQFLARMTLLEDVKVKNVGGQASVTLEAVPLGQLRAEPVPGVTERYEVTWSKGGKVQSNLQDKFTFSGSASELAGSWAVVLKYVTSEVRLDSKKLLSTSRSFSI